MKDTEIAARLDGMEVGPFRVRIILPDRCLIECLNLDYECDISGKGSDVLDFCRAVVARCDTCDGCVHFDKNTEMDGMLELCQACIGCRRMAQDNYKEKEG